MGCVRYDQKSSNLAKLGNVCIKYSNYVQCVGHNSLMHCVKFNLNKKQHHFEGSHIICKIEVNNNNWF
jgi:hypothetical protein